jgi:hypothetical protein
MRTAPPSTIRLNARPGSRLRAATVCEVEEDDGEGQPGDLIEDLPRPRAISLCVQPPDVPGALDGAFDVKVFRGDARVDRLNDGSVPAVQEVEGDLRRLPVLHLGHREPVGGAVRFDDTDLEQLGPA